MLKIWNCYLPWQVLQLAELRAGVSHVLLLFVFFALVHYLGFSTLKGTLCICLYTSAVFFFQRRLASGFPVRHFSVSAFRTSPDNFRRTSLFLKALKEKKATAAGTVFSGTRPLAVLTGGERGLGFEVAKQLVREDVDVLMCCPFPAEAKRAIDDIKQHLQGSKAEIGFVELNLAEESSIRRCAEAIKAATNRIDILINNAGILSNGGPSRTNARGDELVLAVNFVGPVLLTELLLDQIKSSGGPARIVNVASLMELNANVLAGYTPLTTLKKYCQPTATHYAQNYSLSKLLIICYTRDLARRLQGTPVSVATLHPGVVFTGIYENWGLWFVLMRALLRTVFKFPAEGAEVVLYCAIGDIVKSGGFYADCELHDNCLSPLVYDDTQNRQITEFVYEHFGMSPKGLL